MACKENIFYGKYYLCSCQKVCDTHNYYLDTIFIDLALNCEDQLWVFQGEIIMLHLLQICFYIVLREISFGLCTDVIEAFNYTSRYLNGLLNINNPNFESKGYILLSF